MMTVFFGTVFGLVLNFSKRPERKKQQLNYCKGTSKGFERGNIKGTSITLCKIFDNLPIQNA